MTDRRRNWQAESAEEIHERNQEKMNLLAQLDEVRVQIHFCGLDFKQYDDFKKQQREIAARLATL